MKKAFQKLISVPLGIDDEDKYIPQNVRRSEMIGFTRVLISFELYFKENSDDRAFLSRMNDTGLSSSPLSG